MEKFVTFERIILEAVPTLILKALQVSGAPPRTFGLKLAYAKF